jgi:hypothetical protein
VTIRGLWPEEIDALIAERNELRAEVERLREALKQIADGIPGSAVDAVVDMREIARAALPNEP